LFKLLQRQPNYIAMVQFCAKRLIFAQPEPKIVELVDIFWPKPRRVRA
jgi:hypothetical protein